MRPSVIPGIQMRSQWYLSNGHQQRRYSEWKIHDSEADVKQKKTALQNANDKLNCQLNVDGSRRPGWPRTHRPPHIDHHFTTTQMPI